MNVFTSYRIIGTRLGRHLSSKTSPYHEYSRQLLKKFLFQTHPDFFGNYLSFQSVNTSNLRYLQWLLEEPMSEQSVKTRETMRTLTFYLKPDDILKEPRKVKVSLSNVLDSICEILETVGAELPPKPKGYTSESARFYYNNSANSNSSTSRQSSNIYGTRYEQYEKTWLTTEIKQTIDFLESLQDRRDILYIKQDLFQQYKDIEQTVIKHTGIAGIEYRNSWSMQNNALLLQQLLLQLQSTPEKFALPWTDLRLVFAVEHGYLGPSGQSAVAIDYLEGIILIDCTEVSATWIDKLRHISVQEMRQARVLASEIAHMQRESETYLQYLLQIHHLRQQKQQPPRAIDTGPLAPPKHRVRITCGHTCTKRQFGQSLHTFLTHIAHPDRAIQFLQDSSSSVSQPSPSPSPSSESSSSSITLQATPLSLHVCMEEAHGMKILADGTLRLDASFFTFLLHTHTKNQSITNSSNNKNTKNNNDKMNSGEILSILKTRFGRFSNNGTSANNNTTDGSEDEEYASFLTDWTNQWLSAATRQQHQLEEIDTLQAHLQCVLQTTTVFAMGSGVTQEMLLRFLRHAVYYLDDKNHLQYMHIHHNQQNHSNDHYKTQTSNASNSHGYDCDYGGHSFDRFSFEQFYYPYYDHNKDYGEDDLPRKQKDRLQHCRIKNRGVLKHLAGFRVSVGHYAAILEDGTCVLPWDFQIEQLCSNFNAKNSD